MRLTVELTPHEAAALLHFLRGVYGKDLSKEFEQASVKVRIALRDKVEPGWRDEFLKE
jgi:hypothetical protein